MNQYILLGIIGISVFILAAGCVIKKPEIAVNFILRIVLGFVGIYLLNSIFLSKNLNCTVGINGISTVALGFLGTPGFILLYAISIYFELLK